MIFLSLFRRNQWRGNQSSNLYQSQLYDGYWTHGTLPLHKLFTAKIIMTTYQAASGADSPMDELTDGTKAFLNGETPKERFCLILLSPLT
jgi:hypothetical protein